ncbi:hypothetical protein F5B21DRAFT_506920 [Xylaria acuta]|nr:hypothetical protein F5B21DRAFT_506920 [Xylaria acuta]
MNSRDGNPNLQDSPGARRSSSGSSMSLNPEATAFSCRQPESHGYPVGPSGRSRSGRGRGKGQPGTFPLPQIPPRPGRQGQHPQPLPIMQGMCPRLLNPPPFGAGSGYQPMYPILPPPLPPTYLELSGMPYPPPPPGYQQQGYHGLHHNADQNGTGFTGGQSEVMRQSVASISEDSHSRTESQSSQGGPLVLTEKMLRDRYHEEFEAARSFEDGHIYFPKLFPEDKK